MRQGGQSHGEGLYEGAYGGCNTNGFGNSDLLARAPRAWWLRLSKDTIISVALLATVGLLAGLGLGYALEVRARATWRWSGQDYANDPAPILMVISIPAPLFYRPLTSPLKLPSFRAP